MANMGEFSGMPSTSQSPWQAGSASASSSGGGGYTDQQSAADSLRLQEEYLNEHPITYDPLSGRFRQLLGSGKMSGKMVNSPRKFVSRPSARFTGRA